MAENMGASESGTKKVKIEKNRVGSTTHSYATVKNPFEVEIETDGGNVYCNGPHGIFGFGASEDEAINNYLDNLGDQAADYMDSNNPAFATILNEIQQNVDVLRVC